MSKGWIDLCIKSIKPKKEKLNITKSLQININKKILFDNIYWILVLIPTDTYINS